MTTAERAEAGAGNGASAADAGIAPSAPELDLRLVGGSPTPEELAAAHAVLEQAVRELHAHHEQPDAESSRWQRAQRAMRTPIVPGPGRWQSFGH
ncbi:acyl-CoA carboxylase subunit epsilon [Ruicaihuangia caeni]|uniref:Acyl-CoA carboxylase subunit epsilon n=1 Tax=Ruicaihuangia caeni TaxID=3042517 RepID=A0AAW6TAM1_9MICO|nr:acyl-CoA carboxylase subunit epsilon [Klugiella sp. YN-L-19]MDI2099373.1 acyl-CoA carboxylase subunit epsilon [Klugiella sp. YN-L-19]